MSYLFTRRDDTLQPTLASRSGSWQAASGWRVGAIIGGVFGTIVAILIFSPMERAFEFMFPGFALGTILGGIFGAFLADLLAQR